AVGHALTSAGNVTETRRLCQRLFELENGAYEGVAWQNLGFVAFDEGDYDQAVEHLLRAYEFGEAAPDELFDHVLNPVVLALFLSSTGRDATEFIEQALDRANAANWPTAVAYANCAAGLDLSYTDATASLGALDRAIQVAAGVGSRRVETMAQNFKLHGQSGLLTEGELAVASIDLLQRLQHIGDTSTTLLALSNVIVLLDKGGRHGTAAVVCGWLDGRSGRNVQTVGDHDSAVSSIRRSVGDQWDQFVDRGHSMTRNQIIDFVCEELATID
ncbi:MAG: hypothetical protein ABIP17_00545, partial [Ilumatobacteraceae bacterium]